MLRGLTLLTLAGLATGYPAPGANAQPLVLDALAGLERGEWELKERGGTGVPRRICVGDPVQLLQPRNPERQCKRFVLENGGERAAITYDCGPAGQGRTALRVETARLVQIDSQGVASGAPFALTIEGRRIGVCRQTASVR